MEEPSASAKGRGIPMRALIPNAVTVLALCFGLTGVRLAIAGDWERAVAAVVLAGVLDGLDGRIARMLKGSSRFGAELDSLSDVTAFGVAPALIIYLWSLQYLPGIGWLFALSHAVCCALRLARFNAHLDSDDVPHKKAGFFTGVPAPLGAGLTLSPLFFDHWLDTEFFRQPIVSATIVSVVAFLMISSLPTFSWKAARVKAEWRLLALVAIGLFAGALFSVPWMTLSLISIFYAATIPLSLHQYRQIRQREAQGASPEAPPSAPQ